MQTHCTLVLAKALSPIPVVLSYRNQRGSAFSQHSREWRFPQGEYSFTAALELHPNVCIWLAPYRQFGGKNVHLPAVHLNALWPFIDDGLEVISTPFAPPSLVLVSSTARGAMSKGAKMFD